MSNEKQHFQISIGNKWYPSTARIISDYLIGYHGYLHAIDRYHVWHIFFFISFAENLIWFTKIEQSV